MKKIEIKTNCKKLLSDIYTPVGIYLRLRDRFRDTILLESTDFHAAENSYSFICINAIAGIEITDTQSIEFKLPGQPPEYGGRNATLEQVLAHQEELSRRRIYHSFNPQGLGIIGASLLTFGTPEQKQRWAIPLLRGEMTASLGMSEPGAGSDLAGLRTRAVLDGDDFVVNGQKVWTSGAHDSDVLLTFVRTDPDAPKHRGISVLLIPTDSEGVTCRPFASMTGADDVDFNEVFFTDVRVPVENLIGELDKGWAVANGSLGHERTMLWISYAERLDDLIRDAPSDQEWYASLQLDVQALRLLGYEQLSGGRNPAEISLLKLLGSEALQRANWHALEERGQQGLIAKAHTVKATFEGALEENQWVVCAAATMVFGAKQVHGEGWNQGSGE